MNALGFLYIAFLVWWIFIKHKPSDFVLISEFFNRGKKNDKDENGNQ
ncbi:MAG: hypothetical protein NC409_11075 [Clostridium sp.]|nr:hypothetical protein [Clostridium sp.]